MKLLDISVTTIVFAMAACGGGGGGSGGSVSGTVHGNAIAVADAISDSVVITTQTGTAHAAAIGLGTTSGLCNDAGSNVRHPNEKLVLISMFDVNGTTLNTPTVPGTYAIYQGTGTPPPKAAALSVGVVDATCTDVTASDAKATTGTVTLTNVSGNQFSGSYDVALDSGDHITGSFDPEACPGLQTAISSTTAPSCI